MRNPLYSEAPGAERSEENGRVEQCSRIDADAGLCVGDPRNCAAQSGTNLPALGDAKCYSDDRARKIRQVEKDVGRIDRHRVHNGGAWLERAGKAGARQRDDKGKVDGNHDAPRGLFPIMMPVRKGWLKLGFLGYCSSAATSILSARNASALKRFASLSDGPRKSPTAVPLRRLRNLRIPLS